MAFDKVELDADSVTMPGTISLLVLGQRLLEHVKEKANKYNKEISSLL